MELLLVRPFLEDIFSEGSDSTYLPACGVQRDSSNNILHPKSIYLSGENGIEKVDDLMIGMLDPLFILAIHESGRACYRRPTRLDLQKVIYDSATYLGMKDSPPVSFFKGRDILVFSDGEYTCRLMFADIGMALLYRNEPYNEFIVPQLIYAATWIEDGDRENLRRLEATAFHLLEPYKDIKHSVGIKELPKLPKDWQKGFVKPMFKDVKERLAKLLVPSM